MCVVRSLCTTATPSLGLGLPSGRIRACWVGCPVVPVVSLQLSDRCRPYSQELRERLWEKLFENVPTPNRPAAAMAPMLLENSINQIKMDGCYRHTK